MEHAARRPLLAVATLTTAGALALTPVIVTPSELSAPRQISSHVAIQLTDAWSDLASATVSNLGHLGKLFVGTDASYPLPSPTIPLAPILTQLVLNDLIYFAQAFTGDAGNIPLEIATHLSQAATVVQEVFTAASAIVPQQLTAPFLAVQAAIEFVTSSTDKLAALLQAPAVFLNFALNSDVGLLGQYGPIAVSLIFRNLMTQAIYTPLPTIVLPFKKAAAAASAPAATPAAPKPAGPSGTASSARSPQTSPSSSSRKAAAKSDKKSSTAGKARSNRG
ncbi:hypothetical protein ACTXG7_06865 [Mycolicibacterium sp. Dal123E01]|uniref:hypothetical protein n=1 Tax=Mycolicibacterium sp. Dal123E01 TaxID=3457578 RepID=UPI00403EE69C